MKLVLLVWASAVLALPTTDTLPPQSVYFENKPLIGGQGCPANSFSVAMANDAQSLTVIFDKYVDSLDAGSAMVSKAITCQLSFPIVVPQGWQFTLQAIDYRGFMHLDAGISVTQTVKYGFKSSPHTISEHKVFKGPYEQDYLIHKELKDQRRGYSACDKHGVTTRTLVAELRFELRRGKKAPKDSAGQVTVDSFDTKVAHTAQLHWKKC